jgi:hypothetical protein
MPRLKWFLIGVLSSLALGALTSLVAVMGARGFSAREQPTTLERIAAPSARSVAMPADAKARANPLPDSPEVIADGLAHWADHYAACHANNGSGDTEMSKHMYPPAPDMRQAATQDFTDGSCFTSSRTVSGSPACRAGETARAATTRIRGSSSGSSDTCRNSPCVKSSR